MERARRCKGRRACKNEKGTRGKEEGVGMKEARVCRCKIDDEGRRGREKK